MFWQDARSILMLAWPIFIGQIAVVTFGAIDTVMVARVSTTELAALALGAAIYISVYMGLAGVLQALSPITAQLLGGGHHHEIGEQVRQSVWLACVLALIGMCVLFFPYPFLSFSQADPQLISKATHYLHMLAFGLPAALGFRIYSALNNGLARPLRVTILQFCSLMLKVPLNTWFMFGGLGVPAMGGAGCALASSVLNWLCLIASVIFLYRSGDKQVFLIFARYSRPHRERLKTLLRLGLPIGLSNLIEVSAFAFMALFIARLGATQLAAHQITSNLSVLLYMLPLSLAMAASTLIAQAIGAGNEHGVRRLSWNSIYLAAMIASAIALGIGFNRMDLIAVYTPNPDITKVAMPLFFLIALYQVFDALQVMAAFILRAHKITFIPLVIYMFSLWGLGLGGGYALSIAWPILMPFGWHGAIGFWLANSLSLAAAALFLMLYLAKLSKPLRDNELGV